MKITPPNITPGPWHDAGTNRIHAPGSVVCSIPRGINEAGEWEEKHPEIGANARAIAATPQLCAALVELEQWCRAWSKDDGDLSKKEMRANFHKFAAQQAERARQALTLAGYTITPS